MKTVYSAILIPIALLVLSTSTSTANPVRMGLARTEKTRPVGYLASDHRPSTSEDTPVLPLRGDVLKLGIFYTHVQVNGITMNVSVDTGSSDLIVPAATCVGCIPGTPSYDPTKSPNSQAIPCVNSVANCTGGCLEGGLCGFYNSYVTCDLQNLTKPCIVSGPIYKDMVTFGGKTIATYFGSITNQSKDFQQMQLVDGIIGMAYWDATAQKPEAFAIPPFQNMYEQGLFSENRFGMCLRNNSGALVLGGDDPSLFSGPFQYTPIIEKRWYSVYIGGMSVGPAGSAPLPIPSSQMNAGICIVDSGTNFLLLNNGPFAVLKQYFYSLCSSNPLPGVCGSGPGLFDGVCQSMTAAQIASFPPVNVMLKGGVTLTMTGFEYLVRADNGTVCLAIGGGGETGSCIIGDVVLQPYYTAFDRTTSQIGFAPVNVEACAAAGSTSLHPREIISRVPVAQVKKLRGASVQVPVSK